MRNILYKSIKIVFTLLLFASCHSANKLTKSCYSSRTEMSLVQLKLSKDSSFIYSFENDHVSNIIAGTYSIRSGKLNLIPYSESKIIKEEFTTSDSLKISVVDLANKTSILPVLYEVEQNDTIIEDIAPLGSFTLPKKSVKSINIYFSGYHFFKLDINSSNVYEVGLAIDIKKFNQNIFTLKIRHNKLKADKYIILEPCAN